MKKARNPVPGGIKHERIKISFMNKYTDEIYSSDGMKQGDNAFAVMQAQKLVAFHRAFTSANLCEYYVNLEKKYI